MVKLHNIIHILNSTQFSAFYSTNWLPISECATTMKLKNIKQVKVVHFSKFDEKVFFNETEIRNCNTKNIHRIEKYIVKHTIASNVLKSYHKTMNELQFVF